MKNKWIAVLLTSFFVFCVILVGNAATVTVNLLGDYDITNNINDVIHLGDATYTSFYRDSNQGNTWSVNFDLPIEPENGNFKIFLKHFGVNIDRGYENSLYVNSLFLGYLSPNDTGVHWTLQDPVFNGNNINHYNNILAIYSGRSVQIGEDTNNYDDFEFTNVYLTYEAVPIPAAAWLLGTGLVGLVGLRRKLCK